MKNAELVANYRNLDLKKLPAVIKKNGFVYHLVKRNERKLLYCQYTIGGKIVAWEVFKNHIRPYRSRLEQFALIRNLEKDYSNEPTWHEVFPSHEEFGKRAWTYSTLKEAEKAFDEK